ncbi:MAG: hypothetical protein AAGH89_19245 [Verrucomicrobiota bacterium]
MKKKLTIWLIAVATLTILIGYGAALFWSLQTPATWAAVESGMERSEVLTLLEPSYGAPAKAEDGSDTWQTERPVGSWTLTVTYDESNTVHTTTRKYSKSLSAE